MMIGFRYISFNTSRIRRFTFGTLATKGVIGTIQRTLRSKSRVHSSSSELLIPFDPFYFFDLPSIMIGKVNLHVIH